MESIQYNAALAITSVIRGTYREKIYDEPDLESLRSRRRYRTTFSKYLKVNLQRISSEYFLALSKQIIQEVIIAFPSSVVNIAFLEIFFSSAVIEWNNLG